MDGDHRFSRLNPAAGLSYAPSANLTAWLGYNQGSRAPSVVELGCADPANPCRLPNAMASDPALRQVVTHTWEAGVRGKFTPNLRWQLGGFRADSRDDIPVCRVAPERFWLFQERGPHPPPGRRAGLERRAWRV